MVRYVAWYIPYPLGRSSFCRGPSPSKPRETFFFPPATLALLSSVRTQARFADRKPGRWPSARFKDRTAARGLRVRRWGWVCSLSRFEWPSAASASAAALQRWEEATTSCTAELAAISINNRDELRNKIRPTFL